VAFTLLLSACGAYTPLTPNPSDLTSIKQIALIGPDEPKMYEVIIGEDEWAKALNAAIVGGAAQSEIAGNSAMVSGSAQDGPSAPLMKAAQEAHLEMGEEMHAAIRDALIERGYEVVTVPSLGRDRPAAFASSYSNVPATADAILDVLVVPNYSDHKTDGFRPAITLYYRLIDRRTAKVLGVARYVYQGVDRDPADTNIVADPKYDFATYDNLKSNPHLAVAGLRAGEKPLAELLANDLPNHAAH
jgi:hypothetical protein